MRVVSQIPVMVGVDATFSVQALSPSELEAELEEARAYTARLGDSIADSSVVVRHQVIETADSVARVILKAAAHEHADLIALGTHAKTGVSRLVLGSVSEEVLESSPIPVLLVHPTRGTFADTSSNIPATTGVGLASADRLGQVGVDGAAYATWGGGPVTHNDIDADAWTGGAIAAGFVPADYAVLLRWLTGIIISGNGSRPNDNIENVTGRPPISFREFVRRNAHAWALQAAR
jgi:nucleotide-binding universal stress UspA family protein